MCTDQHIGNTYVHRISLQCSAPHRSSWSGAQWEVREASTWGRTRDDDNSNKSTSSHLLIRRSATIDQVARCERSVRGDRASRGARSAPLLACMTHTLMRVAALCRLHRPSTARGAYSAGLCFGQPGAQPQLQPRVTTTARQQRTASSVSTRTLAHHLWRAMHCSALWPCVLARRCCRDGACCWASPASESPLTRARFGPHLVLCGWQPCADTSLRGLRGHEANVFKFLAALRLLHLHETPTVRACQIPPSAQWSVQQLVASGTAQSKGGVSVDRATVERLARLSHLPISAAEVDAVRQEIESLLHFVAIVQVSRLL